MYKYHLSYDRQNEDSNQLLKELSVFILNTLLAKNLLRPIESTLIFELDKIDFDVLQKKFESKFAVKTYFVLSRVSFAESTHKIETKHNPEKENNFKNLIKSWGL